MTLQEAIEKAGNKSKLASLLGVSRAAITQWKELSPKWQEKIYEAKPEWRLPKTEKVE